MTVYRTTYWRTLSEWKNHAPGEWKTDLNAIFLIMSLSLLIAMYQDRCKPRQRRLINKFSFLVIQFVCIFQCKWTRRCLTIRSCARCTFLMCICRTRFTSSNSEWITLLERSFLDLGGSVLSTRCKLHRVVQDYVWAELACWSMIELNSLNWCQFWCEQKYFLSKQTTRKCFLNE